LHQGNWMRLLPGDEGCEVAVVTYGSLSSEAKGIFAQGLT